MVNVVAVWVPDADGKVTEVARVVVALVSVPVVGDIPLVVKANPAVLGKFVVVELGSSATVTL
jgi:hypothetical protein